MSDFSILLFSEPHEHNYVQFPEQLELKDAYNNKISVFKQREKVLPLDGVEGMPVGHLIVINVIRA